MRTVVSSTVFNVYLKCEKCGREGIYYAHSDTAEKALARLPQELWSGWDLRDGHTLCVYCTEDSE